MYESVCVGYHGVDEVENAEGFVDCWVVEVDRLRQKDEGEPDNEQDHVDEEQPASKVEQTADTWPIRPYSTPGFTSIDRRTVVPVIVIFIRHKVRWALTLILA